MTREEFALRWSAAERRSGSLLWSLYISSLLALFSIILCAGVFLCASPFLGMLRDIPEARTALRFKALWIICSCVAAIGGINLAEWACWTRWLKRSGLECPECRHILNQHTGTYLVPHVPGRCTHCEGNGRCRKVVETGLCDGCGHRIFQTDGPGS